MMTFMRTYFPLLTGVFSLGTELLVVLALMELPPFGKGDSDMIWGLPFFGLLVLGTAIPGLLVALYVYNRREAPGGLVIAGLVMNTLSLAIPILVLAAGFMRIWL